MFRYTEYLIISKTDYHDGLSRQVATYCDFRKEMFNYEKVSNHGDTPLNSLHGGKKEKNF